MIDVGDKGTQGDQTKTATQLPFVIDVGDSAVPGDVSEQDNAVIAPFINRPVQFTPMPKPPALGAGRTPTRAGRCIAA